MVFTIDQGIVRFENVETVSASACAELTKAISVLIAAEQAALCEPDALHFLPDTIEAVNQCRRASGLSEPGSTLLISATHPDGLAGGLLLLGNRILEENGNEASLLRSCSNLLSLLATRLHDIELLHRSNRQLALDARHDALTGLPNRRYLIEETGKLLSREARGGGHLHVAFIDLDGFKQINDTHGHETGDAFLMAVARRLADTARTGDIVARLVGDEFVVIATSGHTSGSERERERIIERMRSAVAGHYLLPGGVSLDYPGPSIGCVSCSEEGADIDTLLKQADSAMNADKQQRRQRR